MAEVIYETGVGRTSLLFERQLHGVKFGVIEVKTLLLYSARQWLCVCFLVREFIMDRNGVIVVGSLEEARHTDGFRKGRLCVLWVLVAAVYINDTVSAIKVNYHYSEDTLSSGVFFFECLNTFQAFE